MELLMFQSLRSETGVDRQSLRQTLSLRRRRQIASSVSTTRVRGSASGSRKSSENAPSVSLRNALIMTYTKAWSGTRRKKICENSCRRARAATGDTASAYGSTKIYQRSVPSCDAPCQTAHPGFHNAQRIRLWFSTWIGQIRGYDAV